MMCMKLHLILQTGKKYKPFDVFYDNQKIVFNKKNIKKLFSQQFGQTKKNNGMLILLLIPTCFFFNRMHTKLRPNKLWQIVKKKIFNQFLVPLYQLLVKLSVKLVNYVIGLQITLIYTHCFMLFNLENILERMCNAMN